MLVGTGAHFLLISLQFQRHHTVSEMNSASHQCNASFYSIRGPKGPKGNYCSIISSHFLNTTSLLQRRFPTKHAVFSGFNQSYVRTISFFNLIERHIESFFTKSQLNFWVREMLYQSGRKVRLSRGKLSKINQKVHFRTILFSFSSLFFSASVAQQKAPPLNFCTVCKSTSWVRQQEDHLPIILLARTSS